MARPLALPRGGIVGDAPRTGRLARGTRAHSSGAASVGASLSTTQSSASTTSRCAPAARRRAGSPRRVRAAPRAGGGVPVLRRSDRGGNRRRARRHGPYGATRLGEGARAASARARIVSRIAGVAPCRAQSPRYWSQLAALIDALLDAARSERAALDRRTECRRPSRRSELERLLAECEREPPLLGRPARRALRRPARDRCALPRSARRALSPDERAWTRRDGDRLSRPRPEARARRRGKGRSSGAGVGVGQRSVPARDRDRRQLHHPHIVPLYDSGNADGALYYVMPYEAGPSLRQRLARDGPLPLDDAVLILRDVCDALAYAHQHGIVHRDIKPDNVLLSGRHAMVTDFGVAKARRQTERRAATASVTPRRITLGTPAYMAPEQIAGDDPRSIIAPTSTPSACWRTSSWQGDHRSSATPARASYAAHLRRSPAPVDDVTAPTCLRLSPSWYEVPGEAARRSLAERRGDRRAARGTRDRAACTIPARRRSDGAGGSGDRGLAL